METQKHGLFLRKAKKCSKISLNHAGAYKEIHKEDGRGRQVRIVISPSFNNSCLVGYFDGDYQNDGLIWIKMQSRCLLENVRFTCI